MSIDRYYMQIDGNWVDTDMRLVKGEWECPYCNKRFPRKTYDTKLNEHKDRYGNRCYGRVGYIV
jgi:hypothetical protein